MELKVPMNVNTKRLASQIQNGQVPVLRASFIDSNAPIDKPTMIQENVENSFIFIEVVGLSLILSVQCDIFWREGGNVDGP